MDLGKALLVTLLVYAITEGVKQQFPKVWATARLGVVFVVGEIVTFGVAASDWGHENIIMGKPLDQLSIISLLIAGLIVAAVSVGFNQVLNTVSNIGQNKPSPAQQKALDAGAELLNERLQHPGTTADPAFVAEVPPGTTGS